MQVRGTGGDSNPGKGEKSSRQSKEQVQTPKEGRLQRVLEWRE